MHIKQIIIQGFRSYKDRTVIEPLDKRHNVFVGRNGSGKSNFFSAIQFVISDEYAHLKLDHRRSLLHQSSEPILQAFVEIIFDNSDSWVPIEYNEIRLRRAIGIKKDHYYLNGKTVLRSEVLNLLESAGLSSSNTYYIVKQGTINQLATAQDSYRLKVLREVAGTKVFDERKNESSSIIRENALKLQKIDEYFNTLEERLQTLKDEMEELTKYQNFDKTRRALEFVLHEIQYNENKAKLTELETKILDASNQQEKLASDLQIAHDTIKALFKKSKNTKKDLALLEEEKTILDHNNDDLIKRKFQLELTIKDLIERNTFNQSTEEELERLDQTIKEKETELEKVKPQYDNIKRQEEQYTRELTLKEHRRNELYTKLGRCNMFNTKEERNEWINNELQSLNQQLKEKERCHDKLYADSKKDQEKIVALTKKIDSHSKESEKFKKNIAQCYERVIELQKKRDQNQYNRNKLWTKENELEQKISSLKYDMLKIDQKLRAVTGKQIQNGCDSVRKVLDSFKSRGGDEAKIAEQYYGTIIDNLTYRDDTSLAVDVTAGSRLFNHIVENENIATAILKEMNKQKLPGEINFMPLNRMDVPTVKYPREKTAVPMVSKLTYDSKYDKAMQFIFGRTLICANMDVASRLSRSSGLDCITLEGDKFSSKGVMSGGYFNPSKSRLHTFKTHTELTKQLKQYEQELLSLNKELDQIGTVINDTVSDMQKNETEKCKLKGSYDKINAELRLYREKLSNIERFRESNEQALNQCKISVEALRRTKESLESELDQELLSQLPVRDREEIKALDDDVQKLKKDNSEVVNVRVKLETQKDQLENLLTNNLKRRREALLKTLDEISLQQRQIVNKNAELKEIDDKIKQNNKKLESFGNKIEEFVEKTALERKELEERTKKMNILQYKINEVTELLEKFAMRRYMLEQKISKTEKDIEQLGTLPRENLYSKYAQMPSKDLFLELKKTNKKLKEFSHVNKKANDHYLSDLEKKKKLLCEKLHLVKGEEKLNELISVIDQNKTDAILFTFKQISKYFKVIFKQLVPTGRASIVMQVKNPAEDESDTSDDNFTGIGIKASFIDAEVETKDINKLSGGQKSLLALALIFAIHKCDPAPFYLFDEIDQTLDSSYRRAVANMIHELSNQAQFITTTFSPEFLEHANKFYGVMTRDKVSYIGCVTKEAALNFIEGSPEGQD